jgi:hypothetical protein
MLKLKDEYPKLTFFKILVFYFKSDKRSGVLISKVFPKNKKESESSLGAQHM